LVKNRYEVRRLHIAGTCKGRAIYEIIYQGKKQRVAITTGSNGLVVGANPSSLL